MNLLRNTNAAAGKPVRVLAVDDSAVMRGLLRRLFDLPHALSGVPAMTLCGVACDGVEGLEAARQLQPDLLLLDLEMPRMHGLDALDCLRRERPHLPVIMCSAYTERGARSTLDALIRGASDYVTKPVAHSSQCVEKAIVSLASELLPKIAALVRRSEGSRERARVQQRAQALSAIRPVKRTVPRVLVIGVSTGGPSALERMLPHLPANLPVPVLIVQHMPKLFTGALAERLDEACAMPVREAQDGAQAMPGTIWIAPGDAHLEIADRGVRSGCAVLRLHAGEPVNHCRPAVDKLFCSAAEVFGAETLALVMTGMGQDGLAGARAVHQQGGIVLAQDEVSSAVWGMPGRVAEAGIADSVVALDHLPAYLVQRLMPMSVPSRSIREVSHGVL